jgi:hypothetical protein
MRSSDWKNVTLLLIAIVLGWVLGWVSGGASGRTPELGDPTQARLSAAPPPETAGFGKADGAEPRRANATSERAPLESQAPLEQVQQNASDRHVPDEGVATCQAALERLFSPSGRSVVASQTDLDELLRDQRMNPAGIVLDATERAALAAIAADWDPRVEDARFFEMVEFWRGVDAALRAGRYLSRPGNQGWTPADFHSEYGTNIVVTDISGPSAGVGEPRRMVIQNPDSNPAMFQAKVEADRIKAQRSRAFKDYLLELQLARPRQR